jgi:hypothetical protein
MQSSDNSRLAKVKAYVDAHPNSTWSAFNKATGIKISDAYYYMIRREMRGFGVGKRMKQAIYLNLFTKSSVGMTQQTKNILKEFITELNSAKHTRLEIIEHPEQRELEIRELGRF